MQCDLSFAISWKSVSPFHSGGRDSGRLVSLTDADSLLLSLPLSLQTDHQMQAISPVKKM
jgi:hypothetical protein